MEDEYALAGWPYFTGIIDVVVTHSPEVVTEWIANVDAYLSLPTVQLKIVYLAVLPGGGGSSGSPAVLQMLVRRHCLFFQLAHAPPQMPEELRLFLANRNYTFFGGYMEWALGRLHRYYQIGGDDTRRLDQGYMMIMHPEVPETDWTVGELSARHINLCCYDAYANYLITMTMYG